MRHRLRVLVLLACLAPASLAPAAAQSPAQSQARKVLLDHLLDTLRNAQSEAEAAPIEARLKEVWLEQASAATTLLLARGARDLGAGSNQDAVDDLDAAVTLDPAIPEVWHRRAVARFQLGDWRGAVRDIEEALKREPRYFPAFRTLATIAESRQDWKGAYAAWQKLMELDPKTQGGAERLKDLKRRALGDVT